MDSWYEPLEVWRQWADDVRGGPVAGGHFLPEQAPEETTRALADFFRGGTKGLSPRAPRPDA